MGNGSTRLYLLGAPRVEQDGKPVAIPRHKALALLAYLAVTQKSHGRDTLATMLWPEADASHARGALRRALADIGKALGKSIIEATAESLAQQSPNDVAARAGLWVDVHSFHALVAASMAHPHSSGTLCTECFARLTEAASLYGDDFMQGFTLPDCPRFDEWQFFQTESYRQDFDFALARLVEYSSPVGDTAAALGYARRWCAQDPLLEAPQRAVMELYAVSGQRPAALRQYREYVRLLREELGTEPSQDLALVAERIRRGEPAREHKQPVRPGDKGTAAPILSAEIRLVTILFAGLANNSSSAVEPDVLADSALALEHIVTDSASQYGGQVSPLLAEGIRVLFGYQQMHEDDPERALRTAVDILRIARERQLDVSIGVGTGRVYFAQPSANGLEATTIGPVLGLAARLQARTPAGGIFVGESTFRHTQGAFKFKPTPFDIGSAARSIKAFELVNMLARPDKARGIEGMRAELIGREHDLSVCTAALDIALQGRGGMISIVGDAGIGKSRLVEELARAASRTASPLWLESRCSEFSSTVPYSPFVDLLSNWLDSVSKHGERRALALSRVLNELVAIQALTREDCDRIAPYVAHLLALDAQGFDSQWGDARPELVLHQTFRAVHDLFIALARHQPLVLVLEDLHWADAISLDLLAHLTDAMATSAILLICVSRPIPLPRLKRLGTLAKAKYPDRYVQVTLGELTPSESRQMVRSMLRIDELPPAIDAILSQVGGNPFFVEETVRSLIQAGSLYPSNGGWSMRAVSMLPVPESIQSVVLSRIDRLTPQVKRVLYAAAVIGRLFQLKLLEMIVPQETDIEQALSRLEEMALVYQDRVVPLVTYSFKHVLIQETAYQTLSRQQREEIHLKVALAIEQVYSSALEEHYEELAHHYGESRAFDKAIEYLVKAGDKSRRASLNQAAIKYFDRALQLAGRVRQPTASMPSQILALSGLGRIHYLLGNPQDAERYLRQAMELGRKAGLPSRALARITYWLGQVLHWQGRYGEQMWLAEASLAQFTDEQAQSLEAAMMNQMVASGSIRRGDRDNFHALAEQNATLLEHLSYAEELPSLYEHVIFSLSDQKQTSQARRWLDRLEQLAIRHNDLHARALVHESCAYQSLAQGRLQDARQEIAKAVELYSNIGDSINLWRCLDGTVWINLMLGDLQAAQEKAWQAIHVADKWRFHHIESESQFSLAVVSLAQHDWKGAGERFRAAIQLAQGSDPFWTEWAGMYGLGRLALAEGNKELAQQQLRSALLHFSAQLVPLGWEQHRWWSLSAGILSGLETACSDSEYFRSLCDNLEEFKLQHAMPPIPMQWYGEPATLDFGFSILDLRFPPPQEDESPDRQLEYWQWNDPVGDCAYSVSNGIEMRAANGRDLWYLNTSSPRLLKSISGDWAIQATCSRPEPDRPAIGGVVLWKDENNMLRLVWGTRGEREVSFEGCVDDTDLIVGRGQLAIGDHQRVWLRLERSGEQVRGLASADGVEWFTLGRVSFPVTDPVEIGIHAVGWIDRTIYPGALPDGTAIRFESVEIKRD